MIQQPKCSWCKKHCAGMCLGNVAYRQLEKIKIQKTKEAEKVAK